MEVVEEEVMREVWGDGCSNPAGVLEGGGRGRRGERGGAGEVEVECDGARVCKGVAKWVIE